MPTYPAHILCPSCRRIAANVTVSVHELLERMKQVPPQVDRFLLRTDQDKPGPSKHLVCCQHCHYPFRASESAIVGQPRTLTPSYVP